MHTPARICGRTPEPVEVTDPARLPLAELHRLLREWVAGYIAGEAAVELLITHDVWLRRPEFLTRCVVVGDRWAGEDDPPTAALDWSAVAHAVDPARSLQPGEALGGTHAEMTVLAVAVSLVGAALRVSLRDLLTGLDQATTRLIVTEISHAAGWRVDTHVTAAVVTGRDVEAGGRR
jgi:hypothetical protein